jgi:hypothetical protein
MVAVRAAHDTPQLLQPLQLLLNFLVAASQLRLESRVQCLEMLQHGLPPLVAPLQVAGAHVFDAVAWKVVVEGLALAAAAERLAACGAGDGRGDVRERWVDHLISAAGAHHVALALVEKQQVEHVLLMVLHPGGKLPTAASIVLSQSLS